MGHALQCTIVGHDHLVFTQWRMAHCCLANHLRRTSKGITAAAIYLYTVYKYYRSVYRHKVIKKKWRKRRWWMLSIHRNRTRQFMDNLLSDLVAEPSGEFDDFVRMSSSDFEYILQKISPIIAKKDTYWREAIPPKIRLALTLRFLATGDSYSIGACTTILKYQLHSYLELFLKYVWL